MTDLSQVVVCNGSGLIPYGMPLQNALAAKNWSSEVEEELDGMLNPGKNRLETRVAGIDGEPDNGNLNLDQFETERPDYPLAGDDGRVQIILSVIKKSKKETAENTPKDGQVIIHGGTNPYRRPDVVKHPFKGFKPRRKRYRRDSIRTAYLEKLASKAEMLAMIAEAEMSVYFDKRMGAR